MTEQETQAYDALEQHFQSVQVKSAKAALYEYDRWGPPRPASTSRSRPRRPGVGPRRGQPGDRHRQLPPGEQVKTTCSSSPRELRRPRRSRSGRPIATRRRWWSKANDPPDPLHDRQDAGSRHRRRSPRPGPAAAGVGIGIGVAVSNTVAALAGAAAAGEAAGGGGGLCVRCSSRCGRTGDHHRHCHHHHCGRDLPDGSRRRSR